MNIIYNFFQGLLNIALVTMSFLFSFVLKYVFLAIATITPPIAFFFPNLTTAQIENFYGFIFTFLDFANEWFPVKELILFAITFFVFRIAFAIATRIFQFIKWIFLYVVV